MVQRQLVKFVPEEIWTKPTMTDDFHKVYIVYGNLCHVVQIIEAQLKMGYCLFLSLEENPGREGINFCENSYLEKCQKVKRFNLGDMIREFFAIDIFMPMGEKALAQMELSNKDFYNFFEEHQFEEIIKNYLKNERNYLCHDFFTDKSNKTTKDSFDYVVKKLGYFQNYHTLIQCTLNNLFFYKTKQNLDDYILGMHEK